MNLFWSERSRELNGLAVFLHSVKELFVFPINIPDWICSWLFWGYRWVPSPRSFKMSSLKPRSCSGFYSSCFCVSNRSLPDGVCKISKRNMKQALCPARSRWEELLALTAVFTPNSSNSDLRPSCSSTCCWSPCLLGQHRKLIYTLSLESRRFGYVKLILAARL